MKIYQCVICHSLLINDIWHPHRGLIDNVAHVQRCPDCHRKNTSSELSKMLRKSIQIDIDYMDDQNGIYIDAFWIGNHEFAAHSEEIENALIEELTYANRS